MGHLNRRATHKTSSGGDPASRGHLHCRTERCFDDDDDDDDDDGDDDIGRRRSRSGELGGFC